MYLLSHKIDFGPYAKIHGLSLSNYLNQNSRNRYGTPIDIPQNLADELKLRTQSQFFLNYVNVI